jgi:hypothetical protein
MGSRTSVGTKQASPRSPTKWDHGGCLCIGLGTYWLTLVEFLDEGVGCSRVSVAKPMLV